MIRKALSAAALLSASFSVQAYCTCIVDPTMISLLQQIVQNTGETAANTEQIVKEMKIANKFLENINTATNGTAAAVENAKSALLEATEQEIRSSDERMANRIRIEAQAEATRRRVAVLDDKACMDANTRESVGGSLATSGYTGGAGSQLHYRRGRGSSSPRAAVEKLKEIQDASPKNNIPYGLGTPAGTLSHEDVGHQHAFLSQMMNPYPPTAPEDLPGSLKGRKSAAEYKTLFEVHAGIQSHLFKIAAREVENKAPTIVAPQQFLNEWKKVSSASNVPRVTITVPGFSEPIAIDDARAEIKPKPIGGSGPAGISEVDYLRMMVYRIYGNATWEDDLQINGPDILAKEQLIQTVVQNRMLLEIMQSVQNQATVDSYLAAGHVNETLGGQLDGILRNLSGAK